VYARKTGAALASREFTEIARRARSISERRFNAEHRAGERPLGFIVNPRFRGGTSARRAARVSSMILVG
jgi:hypothetical protein